MVTGLEVLGAVAACEGLAKDILLILRKFSSAGTEIAALAMRFENDEFLLKHLVGFFERAHDKLPESAADHLKRLFIYLNSRLATVKAKVARRASLAPGGKIFLSQRAKWVLSGDDLKSAESELFDWSQRLESMLSFLPEDLKNDLLIIPGGKPEISPQSTKDSFLAGIQAQMNLQRSVARFTGINPTTTAKEETELFLDRKLIELPTKINSTWLPINLEGNKRVFVELIRLPKPIVDSSGENGLLSSARKEVLGLTSILSHVQSSSMHIFRAEHFFDESGVPGAPFGIVYSWPANISSPVTLLDLLHGQSSDGTKLKPHHPLEDRICIAKHILTAILFMHSSGWVHKSIRSENVLVAHPSASSSGNALGSAYLKGFEFSRRSIAASTGWDDVRNWKRDIYVHPARLLQIEARKDQPQTGERKYRNVFDVYSFGVVCLELGLWKPLDAQGAIFEKAQAGKMKEILYEIARSKIPPLLGTKFVNVIYSCLTAPGDLSDEGANDLLCEVMNDLDSISI